MTQCKHYIGALWPNRSGLVTRFVGGKEKNL